MFLRPLQLLSYPLRLTSNDMRYVEQMRLLEYWGIKDTALTRLSIKQNSEGPSTLQTKVGLTEAEESICELMKFSTADKAKFGNASIVPASASNAALEFIETIPQVPPYEFRRSQFLVMIDRRPLVRREGNTIQVAFHNYSDLRKSLGEYGFSFDTSNSCLLDAVESPKGETVGEQPQTFVNREDRKIIASVEPPEDSPVLKEDVLRELGRCLDAQFVDLRTALLGISNERERNLLAKFQSLSRWSRTFLRCPRCGAPLRMRVSKTAANCPTCPQIYYPTSSPVAITLVADPTDSHALLVRHKGSPPSLYTAIAGFASPGESLVECARREVAEEVGLPVSRVVSLNRTQPWPIPNSSLMCAHYAVSEMSYKIDACPTELESARWFSREEVAAALQRTLDDPLLKGIPKDINERQKLRYIPPHGAIAHHIIKAWVERRMCIHNNEANFQFAM